MLCYVVFFNVISNGDKWCEEKSGAGGLGLQGGDRGCSCKYGGQGRLRFNAKTFSGQSFQKKEEEKKSSKLNFLW